MRPAGGEGTALGGLADKLAGVTVTPELLAAEKPRVLAEVASVAALEQTNPAALKLLRAMFRRPKAGTAADVDGLDVADVQAFLDAHYRPERAVLVVRGPVDPAAVRQRVENSFGVVRPRPAAVVPPGQPPANAPLVATYPPVPAADPAAVRVAAAAWQLALDPKGRTDVEVSGGGAVRVVLPAGAGDRLTATRDALHRPLPAPQFAAARDAAVRPLREARAASLSAGQWAVPKEPAKAAGVVAQAVINRLVFEAEGGQPLLDRLAAVAPDEVAAAARKHLSAAAESRWP